MNKKFINRFYPLVIIILVFIVWKLRQDNTTEKIEGPWVKFDGETMGTISYNITYKHPDSINYKKGVDSLLAVWNQSLSTYIPDSEISRFNKDSCFSFQSKYLLPVLKQSKIVYENTNGAFDPTVGPLVNAWGFGPEEQSFPDSAEIDSLMQYVGFEKIKFNNKKVCKSMNGVQLDFSAIAKGYAVDVVAEYLEDKAIKHYLVEIGGELVCKGKNDKGNPWRTGIENPDVAINQRELYAITNISDIAIATSGNYRNFYKKDGVTYNHTIDPNTGYSVRRNLLSASVLAEDCMTADAYATAFMVMGLDRSKELTRQYETIEAFLVYSDENGNLQHFISKGIEGKIELLNDK